MAIGSQPLSIVLRVENGQIVKAELKDIGEVGQRSLAKIDDGAKEASRGLNEIGVTAGGLGRVLGAAFASIATVDIGRRLIEIGDSYSQMQSRIKLVAGSSDEAAAAQQRLFQIAQDTRAPLEQVVGTYTRLAPALSAAGISAEQSFRVVQTLGQGLIVSGASANEAASGLQQFAQAMGSGRLAGDELRSLLENFPAIGRAIADGLGVGVAALREMGEAGTLTTDVVIPALLSQSDAMAASFAEIERTAGGAFTQLQTQLFQVSGEAINTSGAIDEIVAALDRAREAAASPEFATAIGTMASAMATFFADIVDGIATSSAQVSSFLGGIEAELSSLSNPIQFVRTEFGQLADYLIGRNQALNDSLRGIGEAVVSTIPGAESLFAVFREKAPGAAAAMDGLANSILGVSTEARNAAAAAAAMQRNFAGANNFRAAQDAGTSNALERMAFTAPQAPTPIPSPFQSKARPEAAADAAWARRDAEQGRAAQQAARAAEQAAEASKRALEQAERVYSADEQKINEMLARMSQATDERSRFIESAVESMSADATDEQVEAMKRAAAAQYDFNKASEEATEKRRAQADVELEMLRINREGASAADQFMQKMQYLDGMKSQFGMSDAAYADQARQASDAAATKAEEDFQRQTDAAQRSYDQIAQFAQTTFQGIGMGLADMLVEGEADFETFLKGMAKSIIASGIQKALMGLFTMAFGPSPAAAGAGGGFGSGQAGGGNMFSLFHRGGTMDEPSGMRWLPGASLHGLPRYHTGKRPNEVAALLRDDETVLTPGQMSRLKPANDTSRTVVENKIEIINNSNAQVTAQERPGGQRIMIENMMTAMLTTRGSGPNRAVESMVRSHSNGR